MRPRSPARDLPRAIIEEYVRFHGVPPSKVIELPSAWVPGRMERIGRGVDVGYGIVDVSSEKDGRYVHDWGRDVIVYRRVEGRARPMRGDLVVRSFPTATWALGASLGLTYETSDGKRRELAGYGTSLCWIKSLRALIVVDKRGVLLLARGGKMRVTDWIRG